jgi:uncharacterized membrane protein YqiK
MLDNAIMVLLFIGVVAVFAVAGWLLIWMIEDTIYVSKEHEDDR